MLNSGNNRTRSTEGFYRSQAASASASASASGSTDGSVSLTASTSLAPPVHPQTMDRHAHTITHSGVVEAAPVSGGSTASIGIISTGSRIAMGSTNTTTTTTTTTLLRTTTGGSSGITRPGALRPPNELGRIESKEDVSAGNRGGGGPNTNNNNKPKSPVAVHPRSAAVRKRTMAAIRSSMTHAATAMSAEALAAAKQKTQADDPSMLCSLTYRGMEVIFASTHSPLWQIYGICARTRLVFQTLDLPAADVSQEQHQQQQFEEQDVQIVNVMANQTSGLIAVALSDGTIQTYQPVPTDPKLHPFGRFRWINGFTIRCSRVFYQPGETVHVRNKRHAKKPGQDMQLASSQDQKLLVAHRNQLAVFDVNLTMENSNTNKNSKAPAEITDNSTSETLEPTTTTTKTDTTTTAITQQQEGSTPPVAQLLWTTTTAKPIVTVAMSGDGQALAVVLNAGTAGVYDTTCGVRIFLRDRDDGSLVEEKTQTTHQTKTKLQRTPSVGILYKQGPLLEHSEPVTRITFRGLGHNTASAMAESDDEGGDDLLLTYSKHDCVARIYNQHSWNRLVEWTTPKNTRVDWVRGAAAFSLGDLETQKRLVPNKPESKPPSRSPSSATLSDDAKEAAAGGILQGGRQLLHNSSPSSAAGAWIAETTFSGVLPALRLSRLSFLKRGSETMHPALFESVASMLPSGSMVAESILNAGDDSLSIHGIWPAWNPWLSETSEVHSEETLSGSAMAFLGLSSGPSAASGGPFGEGILGGSHSPPNELRIVASHPLCGNVVVMEFPLWGNRDLGELELGSAVRYVLSLPDIEQGTSDSSDWNAARESRIMASTDYESNRLVARLRSDSASIALSWMKQGTLSICPSSWEPHDYDQALEEPAVESVGIAEHFRDCSLVPAPLSLPPVFLPSSTVGRDAVKAVMWWPDENFGGPPMLVVITSSGTLLVFEVPPPWSAQEPPMPTSDPFLDFSGTVKGVDSFHDLSVAESGTGADIESDDEGWSSQPKEYDVMITPHPDFGLGLRLESQMDGMPAIAGSYKKHPLTGGRLPAEKLGMIVLGDELLSVNGVRLEGISFDEIIATVRQVGAKAGAGNPLSMRFRRVTGRRRRGSQDNQDPSMQVSDGARRSMEQMLGVGGGTQRKIRIDSAASSMTSASHPHRVESRGSLGSYFSRTNSDATILVGADAELQQEFCRLVAVTRKFHTSSSNGRAWKPCFVLLPWSSGSGTHSIVDVRGVALIFCSDGCKLFAHRLEVSSDCDPDKAKVSALGVFDLSTIDSRQDGDQQPMVQSISVLNTGTESRCLAVCDDLGAVSLIFASLGAKDDTVTFRHYGIFRFDHEQFDSCVVRASSIDLIATMRGKTGELPMVTVWSARPHPAGAKHEKTADLNEYVGVDLALGAHVDIVDLRFLQSGYLDSFPLLATFTRTAMVVYQKLPGQLQWNPIRVISYACVPGSGLSTLTAQSRGIVNPLDTFPHLVSGMRSIVHNCDETQYLRPDWHPDSLLARLCTDVKGPKHSLYKRVASYFVWLAGCVSNNDNTSQILGSEQAILSSLSSVRLTEPFDDGYEFTLAEKPKESSMDLFSRVSKEPPSKDEDMLRKLQSVLEHGFSQNDFKQRKSVAGTNGLQPTSLPSALHSFTPDELRILWALGEVVLARPDFKSVDTIGEFFILTSELLTRIKLLPKDEKEKGSSYDEHIHQFSVKRKVVKSADGPELKEQLPSAATLCALMSNSQHELVESVRGPGIVVDWDFLRENNMPFWIRSDSALAKLSEEVGQNSFKAKRDILECALFFIVARRMRTLRNLAATDQSTGGRKFLGFITDHDFSSERGRRAAEKNAYSLLRKRKYTTAAAFFLLAEPPFLKSSLEVIATQLQDINLAFMVARLMESPELSAPGQTNGLNGGFGGFLGMGGGGGYASFAPAPNKPSADMEQRFVDWRPALKSGARNLLLDRGLTLSKDDNCLTAVQLMWLDQRDEASFWLSGLARDHDCKSTLPDVGDALLPIALDRARDNARTSATPMSSASQPSIRVCSRVNNLINFLSGPILLRSMNGNKRSVFASSLVVSRVLMRCGVDVACVRELLQQCDSSDGEESAQRASNKEKSSCGMVTVSGAAKPNEIMQSSIFDSFDAPPPIAKPKPTAPSGEMSSSIFDSFDAPPPKAKPKPAANSGAMNSSIFDSFDAPRPKPKPMPSAASGEMSSSIFDSFDAPPPKPKPKPTESRGEMASSIFDSFDAAPPKPKPTAPSGEMTSSIFDSFDAPPPKPKPKPTAPSGKMTSSIFDSFDAPPPKLKPVPSANSGAMNPSIFDAFDAPPGKPKPKPTAPSGAMNSSIFDSFDAPHTQPSKPLAPNHQPENAPTSGGEGSKPVEEERKLPVVKAAEIPSLWDEWREQVLLYSGARRLVRELACLMVELHGDAFDPPLAPFAKADESLLPPGAAEVLQLPCEGELILGRIRDLLEKICREHAVHRQAVVDLALRFLAAPHYHNRMFYAVLLHLSCQRGDLAEGLLRDAAHLTVNRCDAFALSNDPPSQIGKTASHMASLYLREHASRLGWQIELCLWLHRGGALPLSGVAINEAIVAVRIGFAVASWNRNYECLETMINSDPDCHMDNEAGRQHWTSLKILSNSEEKGRSGGKASSGGWEFLVDCRRSEATDLLRNKQTGCFIIRPHVEDHGVFTLSFKTNLVPTVENQPLAGATAPDGQGQQDADKPPRPKPSRPVKKDDVVQHAIIRLSDSGFRCGSFGPFGTLMKLLEAVSSSLPFELRFDQPPAERVIKDEGSQPSPNAVFLRKLVLRSADSLVKNPPTNNGVVDLQPGQQASRMNEANGAGNSNSRSDQAAADEKVANFRRNAFGLFLELLVLSCIRRPLSAIASSKYEEEETDHYQADSANKEGGLGAFDEDYAVSARMLRPYLAWCRSLELASECDLAPFLGEVLDPVTSPQITLSASETAIEAIEEEVGLGDSVIRRMIQPNSGVDFRTLRLADGGDSTVVVLFSKNEAIEWLVSHGSEKTKEAAIEKLDAMEKIRVVEPIDLSRLQLKAYSAQKGAKPEEDTGVRYRIVDPWEVEALDNREGETRSASIGRERFLAFSLGKVATACETVFRQIGGLPALELWTAAKGGVALTKAIASVHPPWERGEGGDMQFNGGVATEPAPFFNSIRQHLYRNSLFRSIRLPQRFLALVQVELLDLKNLTAPGGSLSLTVYALLRLRRSDSGAPLTSKTRTLDSAATLPMKLAKSSGPNAPASWGSVVRFRFPLPEDVTSDGVSLDRNREILFKGPPCVLQLSVYERKLLIDNPLGDADVKIDGLAAGGQLEEWVPLRTGKHGINWFARIRLTLRFELMCLASEDADDLAAPSVGLRRIQHLSRMGGAQEDMKKSMSTPDLLSYFESMVY